MNRIRKIMKKIITTRKNLMPIMATIIMIIQLPLFNLKTDTTNKVNIKQFIFSRKLLKNKVQHQNRKKRNQNLKRHQLLNGTQIFLRFNLFSSKLLQSRKHQNRRRNHSKLNMNLSHNKRRKEEAKFKQ